MNDRDEKTEREASFKDYLILKMGGLNTKIWDLSVCVCAIEKTSRPSDTELYL